MSETLILRVATTVVQQESVTVTLPLYRRIDVPKVATDDVDRYYSCVTRELNGKFREVEVCILHDPERGHREYQLKVRVTPDFPSSRTNLDYTCGRGAHASTPDAFRKVLVELRTVVDAAVHRE